MTEYIDREAAKRELMNWALLVQNPAYMKRDDAMYLLDHIPAANVAPVVYGRWVSPHWRNSDYCCNCSECDGEAMHREYQWNSKGIYPICPNCGARMDSNAQ